MTQTIRQMIPKEYPGRSLECVELSSQQDALDHIICKNHVGNEGMDQALLMTPNALNRETWSKILSCEPRCINLKWIQSEWAGLDSLFKTIDGLDVSSIENKVKLTKMGEFGPNITHYCIQHMLNHERNYALITQNQKSRIWSEKSQHYYRSLSDITIGVMGFGDIGSYLCRVFKQLFGSKLHVIRNQATGDEQSVDRVFSFSKGELDTFLNSGIDYLISVIPSTKETRGLLNHDTLKNCELSKPVFINVGRGDIISEKSILNALEKGWISKAILDVFETEPLPQESELWNHEKVVITPHVAAISFASNVTKVFFENLKRLDNSQDLKYSVNWRSGY
jgi:phosphoglycerate dehydrogenase-like enzyme